MLEALDKKAPRVLELKVGAQVIASCWHYHYCCLLLLLLM
jgi:hypothetical protein